MMDDELDAVADYAARGRPYADLSKRDLTSAWVHAFRALPRNLMMVDTRSNYADLTAEFLLRRLKPPYHLLAEDLEMLQAALTSWMRPLPLDLLSDATEHMHAQAPGPREVN
jgi:hypothetical protein